MAHSPKATAKRLVELGAPAMLIQLAQGTAAPGILAAELQTPRAFYTLVADSRFPFRKSIVPLWETNGESITGWVVGPPPQIVSYYYEDPPETYELIGGSIREALEGKLGWLYLETGCEIDEVLAAARVCGLPDPEGFVRRLEAG